MEGEISHLLRYDVILIGT